MKNITWFGLTLLVLITGVEGALASKCSRPPIDTEERFKATVAASLKGDDAIFSGEIIEMNKLTVKFKVEKVWKGDFKGELTMITGTVMIKEGVDLSDPEDYDFELGKKYLVFAHGPIDKLKATTCSWTGVLSELERFVKELDRMKRIANSEI